MMVCRSVISKIIHFQHEMYFVLMSKYYLSSGQIKHMNPILCVLTSLSMNNHFCRENNLNS